MSKLISIETSKIFISVKIDHHLLRGYKNHTPGSCYLNMLENPLHSLLVRCLGIISALCTLVYCKVNMWSIFGRKSKNNFYDQGI